MNLVLEAIQARCTCRDFNGRPVEREKLEDIARAGLQAPSAMNLQRWRIIGITDKQLVDEMDAAALAFLVERGDSAVLQRIRERGGRVLYNASALFLVLLDQVGDFSPELDCGIVVENMALAATALGLSSDINAMCSMALQGIGAENLRERLYWPEGFKFAIGLLVGYTDHEGCPHEIDERKLIWV